MATRGARADAASGSALGVRDRRGRALPVNTWLWLTICLVAVAGLNAATSTFGRRIGEYWSGSIALASFVAIAWYSVRKRNIWFSIRVLRFTGKIFPAAIQRRLVILDRLETWRAFHLTLGMLAILPLSWHVTTVAMSPLEAVLATLVVLLFISGIFGAILQDRLPRAMVRLAEHEVRLEDVDSKVNAVYREAEEKILGHGERLIKAYIDHIKPMLLSDRSASRWTLLVATVRGIDPGQQACAAAAERITESGDEKTYQELLALAARRVNLDHNSFNIHLSTGWLNVHILLSVLTFALLIFHVAGVVYFGGI
jgi:hypothetical protein